MNISYLQKLLSRIDEIKIINKTPEIDGVVCNVARVVRYGQQLYLIILEYDEQFRQQIEVMEISELCEVSQVPETNRIMLKGRKDAAQPFIPIKSVFVGDYEFKVSGSENRRRRVSLQSIHYDKQKNALKYNDK